MNTQLKKKINKFAAKEENRLVNSSKDLTAAAIRDLLYDHDHELLYTIQKLRQRCYVDDLLNRKVYRMATMPYGGMQRRMLIHKFYSTLGKCLACIKILEECVGHDEVYDFMIEDWQYLSDCIENGDFQFTCFGNVLNDLIHGRLG